MTDSFVSFGSGVAIGALVTGVLKVAALAALGIGIGLSVRKILKEQNTCKSGPKQN